MGLLTKFVPTQWNPITKMWYEARGYIYTKWKDEFEVKVEDLPPKSSTLVDIECDGCGELLEDIKWKEYKKSVKEDGKYYCARCANAGFKKWISFFEWCYENLPKEIADYILSRWDYDLNIDKNGKVLSPKDVSRSSDGFNKKGFWFKCLDHPEHKSELKSIGGFTIRGRSIKCKQCNTISITNPELSIFLVNKEDSLKYSRSSKIKLLMRCQHCGHEKKRSLCELSLIGFACECCGDGKSYSNKFLFNFLKQIHNLNIIKDFETEKRFKWLKYVFREKLRQGCLDGYFELNDKQYGVEMDGGFHTKDNKMSGQTKEESKYIDDEKDMLCEKYGIEVIRIDCIKSEQQYIKNGIMDKLSSILNFKENDINWSECHEAGISNLVKIACDLWSNGIKNTIKIAIKLKLHYNTVSRYLKQGAELGWCDYDPVEESNINLLSMHKNNCKKIICIITGEIFNSILEAEIRYNIDASNISKCCRRIQKSAGRHPITGEKLRWQYYSEYIKSNQLPTAI